MKYFAMLLLCLILSLPLPSYALNAYGVQVADAVTVDGQALRLNGVGLRTQLLGKRYVASLYLARLTKKSAEAVNDPGVKLIRLNFVHEQVVRDQFIERLNEAVVRNYSKLAGNAELQRFYGFLKKDFTKGEQVDLAFLANGTVQLSRNNQVLGSITSKELQIALLKAFIGLHPIDEAVRAGMLGKL